MVSCYCIIHQLLLTHPCLIGMWLSSVSPTHTLVFTFNISLSIYQYNTHKILYLSFIYFFWIMSLRSRNSITFLNQQIWIWNNLYLIFRLIVTGKSIVHVVWSTFWLHSGYDIHNKTKLYNLYKILINEINNTGCFAGTDKKYELIAKAIKHPWI